MKTTMLKAGLLAGLSLVGIAAAQADDESGPITAGVTLTSDYRFRGQSQTDRRAAVQGWVQYDHSSGLYVNVWASNIDFNDVATYDSNVEVDLTLGYNHAFSEQTSVGIKGVYYWYADADTPSVLHSSGLPYTDYDYFEVIATASHDFGRAAISGEFAWSPDYFAETGDAYSAKGGVSVPLLEQFGFMSALSASGNVGYQWLDNNISTPPGTPGFFGTPDYLYYDIGASAEWEIFVFDVRWVGTDISDANCFDGTELCDDGIVVSVTANLPG